MLAYPIEEAEALLQSKLKTSQDSLQSSEEDLDFLREQITVCVPSHCNKSLTWPQTMEVATARVYNWDVAERRKLKASGESIEQGEATEPNG
jgi:hypothetical protein